MALPKIQVQVTADTAQAEAGLERVQGEMIDTGRAADRAASRSRQLGRAFRDVSTRSAGLQRGVQNASFQVADFAVQMGGGVDASRAMAQQLPQLLGGFGVLGAVLSAVVAVAIPMATVMGDMAANGEDVIGVFGTLEPIMRSIADAMGTVATMAAEMGNLIVNNIDRIITIAATAAAFFAGKWVVAFVAAKVATMSLSGALLFLRGALIRTGIGAIIVAVGELVFQFTRLSKAAGGFGEAMSLLVNVAREAFGRIALGAKILVMNMQNGWLGMKASFLEALQSMVASFAIFTQDIAAGLNNLFGTNLSGMGSQTAWDLLFSAQDARAAADAGLAEIGAAIGEFNAPLTSIEKIKELLQSMKDDNITLPSILGLGDDEDGGGDKIKDKLSEQEKAIKEHLDRIRALTQGTLGGQLGAWGDYFTNLASLTSSKNDKLLKIGKSFAAAQALINAWSAHNQVLADPTLPWFAKAASALQVLGAGLGAVNAINSVSSSGGSAGGGGAAVGGGGGTSAPQTPLDVRLSGLSADDMISGANMETLFDRLQDEAGDRGLRVSFA